MSLNYPISTPFAIIGTKSAAFALTAEALTNDYADNLKVLAGVTGMTKLDLRYSYTTGAAETNNSLSIRIEESSDLTNWFTIANESVSGGTSTLNARTFVNPDNTGSATNVKSSIGLDIFYDNLRISFLETGVASNYGTIYAEASVLGE